jgi:cytochrome c-type biogenesis protein
MIRTFQGHLPSKPRMAVRLRVTLHSLAFIAGLSMVFIALGFSAGLISNLLFDFGDALRMIAGAFLVFMGLVMLRLVAIPWLQRDWRAHLANKPAGYPGSALVGVAFGAGWTPCIGPILSGILMIAGTTGAAWHGGLLLGTYALGFAIPFLLAAQMLTAVRTLNRYTKTIERSGGVLLIAVGLLLLTDSVAALSPYLANLDSVEGALAGSHPTFLLAFVAGSLSFFSPCVLPILPSFLAYLTGVNAKGLQSN